MGKESLTPNGAPSFGRLHFFANLPLHEVEAKQAAVRRRFQGWVGWVTQKSESPSRMRQGAAGLPAALALEILSAFGICGNSEDVVGGFLRLRSGADNPGLRVFAAKRINPRLKVGA